MRERIKRIIKDSFGISEVPDDISQKTCAEWDSMHHLQLVVGLETEFDISFEPEDIGSMQSLAEIEERIKSLMKSD
ncbi:MAG: acyl carrier protein [Treponema sp.]|jgi:acyl carrier protein|nr:acyl carrier protein [Treponema sp.]